MAELRRPVAIVSWASFETPNEPARNEVEMLLPVIQEAVGKVGLTQQDIGFTVSGSSDYLQGFPFAFGGALRPGGLSVRARRRARRGRRVPPDPRVARRDGRRVRPLRSRQRPPGGGHRHRARLRVRPAVAWGARPDARAATRPLLRRTAVAGRAWARRVAGAGDEGQRPLRRRT